MTLRSSLSALAIAVLFPGAAHPQDAPHPNAGQVVRSYVDAFNRHDVSAMISMVDPAIEVFYPDGDGLFSLASSSAEQLAADLTAYFEARPEVKSSIRGLVDGPAFVSFREQIVGGASSLAVYEVRQGLVRRAWYFPSEGAVEAPPAPARPWP